MPASRSYVDVHYNQILTNFSVAHFQSLSKFLATVIFQPVMVKHASNKFTTYPRGFFNRSDVDTSVGEETKAHRISYGTARDSYSVDEHALRSYISDQSKANVDTEQNLVLEHTRLVTEGLLIGREKTFADNFLKTGVWGADVTGGNAKSGTVGSAGATFVKWANDGGDPIKDIREWKRYMQEVTAGLRPNCMVFSRDVYDTLLDHADILDRIKGGATTALPAIAMMKEVAKLFELERILIWETIHNMATDGLVDANTGEPPTNLKFTKSNFAFLYYCNPITNPEKYTATAGVTFVWNRFLAPTNIGGKGAGPIIRRYRPTPELLGEYIEGRYSQAPKVISKDCGLYIHTPI